MGGIVGDEKCVDIVDAVIVLEPMHYLFERRRVGLAVVVEAEEGCLPRRYNRSTGRLAPRTSVYEGACVY